MSINIEQNLQRRFRSLAAIGRDLFLLGGSQSRLALFSVLTCLILISSIAQAATPTTIDLKEAVDEFVRSIPGSKQGGYKDPNKDPIAITRLVEGFKKARNGQLSPSRKDSYTAVIWCGNGSTRELCAARTH
jgi:hypothetical protein